MVRSAFHPVRNDARCSATGLGLRIILAGLMPSYNF